MASPRSSTASPDVRVVRPPLTEDALPAAAELAEHWPEGPPRVSVICATYNHERWIADALCGFLAQRTPFRFEVLVGEDCSTDGTRAVVQRFVDRYPGIVRLVTGERNVGARANHRRLWESARGEWIAFCEGDDFWTDRDKLARQLAALDAHPACDMACHAAVVLRMADDRVLGSAADYGRLPRRLDSDEVIRHEHGVIRLASLVVRRQVLLDLPDWFYPRAPMGDFFIQAYGSRRDGIRYLPQVMSAYRDQVAGGWTQRLRDPAKLDHFVHESTACLDLLRADFPGHDEALDFAAGNFEAFAATIALDTGDDGRFRTFMAAAAAHFRGHVPPAYRSRVLLRRWPGLLRRLRRVTARWRAWYTRKEKAPREAGLSVGEQ